jgi:hypothetical protein
MLITPGKLLSHIDSPSNLRKLNPEQLVQLSEELREFIIDTVSVYGGHFGASLGVVELTVALHYFIPIAFIRAYPASRNAAKANTTPSGWGIRLPLFLQRWVWPWPISNWASIAST